MQHYLVTLVIISILCWNSGCSPAPTVEAVNQEVQIPAVTRSMLESFERKFLDRFEDGGSPGAVVTIVHKGEIYSKGYGIRKVGKRGKVDKFTVFRLGSLSKGFAGALTSILVAEGKLNWGHRVADILPNFQLKDSAQTERITAKHLLSHSTGLQRHAFTNLIEAGVAMDNIIPEFTSLDLISEEGEIYAYANAPFAMIEKVLTATTNKSFAELLEDKIFAPAAMRRASTSLVNFDLDRNIAFPLFYSDKHNGFRPRKISKKYDNAISAGGVNACGEDMGHWMNVLLGHRPDIISEKALDDLFEPVVPTRSNRYYDRWTDHPTHYALGWRVLDFDDSQIMHHGGYVNNYRSEIAIDRENDLGICVIFNAFNPEANLVVPDFLKCIEPIISANTLLDSLTTVINAAE